MRKLLLLTTLVCWFSGLPAADLEGVRLWTAPDHTRLVFDIDAPVEHRIFTLDKPARLVIDIKQSRFRSRPDAAALTNRHIEKLRHAVRENQDLRVVLDLKAKVRPKSFLLKPNTRYGHRLVVDLYDGPAEGDAPRVAKSAGDIDQPRDIVIAIDAGHGGEDPGASGRLRSKEKHLTLATARELKKLVDAEPGMRAVLTRTGDYYVGLRKRMAIARRHRADLFISLHADAFRDKRVHGSSVYVLSHRGASSEAAKWLADKENAADLVGGVTLDGKDQVLRQVLLDLSQSATQQASLSAASRVYRQLRTIGKVHGRRVQRAGFMVLKSPDIPSLLVEMGFISNPTEERRLNDAKHRRKLAGAVLGGVKRYFKQAPPPGTLWAQNKQKTRKHVIQRGDTLSAIAQRYQTSMTALRKRNQLKTDRIRVGQVLRIPES